ncbi:MAG TPA: hypothetical protein VHF58_00895 [Solirubrobacterales bacterium]|nr:hypothetical protein [Solirubrobacterales bacterium]
MARLKRTAVLTLIAAAGIAGQASAATTLGQTFVPEAGLAGLCAGDYTFLQTTSAAIPYAAPSSGVITEWSFHANATPPSSLRFKVARREAVNEYRITGQSELKTPVANTLNTYPAQISVSAGDVIGFYLGAGGAGCSMIEPGYQFHYLMAVDPPPGDLYIFTPQSEPEVRLDLSARLEPDVDNDGFGDETQDGCPTSAERQDHCPSPVAPDSDAPETTLTKDIKRSKTGKARFRFTSDEAGASFECRLKGPDLKRKLRRFRECDSPRRYKNLDEGRFKFVVRAIDAAGNVDPTPAKDRFRVMARPRGTLR